MRTNWSVRNWILVILAIIIGGKILRVAFSVMFSLLPIIIVIWAVSRISNRSDRGFRISNKRNMLFTNNEIIATENENKYHISFSDCLIDLSKLPVPLMDRKLKIDVSFSKGTIIINQDVPAIIKVKSSFSSINIPENSVPVMGSGVYATRSYREGYPHLIIKIDSSFSNVEIKDNRLY
jgi:hypothetical protein